MSKKSSRGAPPAKKKAVRARPLAPAPQGKRERNKAENREEILVAAREVFTELGYDAATVRDIIRRTELASGTFYNYFPDKESVFRELLKESEGRRMDWLRKVERRSGGFEAYLQGTFGAYFEFVLSDRTTFDLLRRNAATIRAFVKDPVIADERERLERGLAAAMEGGFVPRVDPEFLASSILAASFEVAVLMVERDPVDPASATAFMTDLFQGFFDRMRRSARPKAKDRARRTNAAD
jgi:AcrR family transcriptional regulator